MNDLILDIARRARALVGMKTPELLDIAEKNSPGAQEAHKKSTKGEIIEELLTSEFSRQSPLGDDPLLQLAATSSTTWKALQRPDNSIFFECFVDGKYIQFDVHMTDLKVARRFCRSMNLMNTIGDVEDHDDENYDIKDNH